MARTIAKRPKEHDSCGKDEFRCRDGSGCYTFELRCDRVTFCNDASDERGCTCREYLAPHKICDGYADCFDGSDEKGCHCAENRFKCRYVGEIG